MTWRQKNIERAREIERESKAREREKWTSERRAAQNAYLREYRKLHSDVRTYADRKETMTEWRRANPDKVSASHKKWRGSLSPDEKEALLEYNRQYSKQNPDRIRRPNRHAELMKNPAYRIVKNLRSRVNKVIIHDYKSAATLSLLGCTIDQFLGHLEINFEPGMSWENYGKVWHVDHKQPCASFDLTDPQQQRACFNWRNLQPLFAKENLSKGKKILSCRKRE